MLNGYLEAEVTAARVGACKGGYIQKEAPEEFQGDEVDEAGNKVEEMEPGVVKELDPGETFVEHDPKHPNTAFGPFTKSVLRGAAAGTGVSYEDLAKDLEGVNYSSIRAGVLESREEYKTKQEWFIEDLCELVYTEWVPYGILSGRIKQSLRRVDEIIEAAEFQGRRWSWVDPLKDINATVIAIENRLQSHSGAVAEQGGDFEELLKEIQEDQKLAELHEVNLPEVEPPQAQIEDEESDSAPASAKSNGAPKKKKRFFFLPRR
jgi:lambda family phage portal protein